MQFLNPIWLFGIAAISIPVIIHLWNIKPGKTLKVGSIALINASAQKSSRSFKLNDIPLFLVRCLLLSILAFLLAAPVWQRYLSSGKTKGWILIPKENLNESYNKYKVSIDSLTKAGYEFHYFNNGFEKMSLDKILINKVLRDTFKVINYWNLVAHLNNQLPATVPVYLFTPNQVRYFNGNKPSVSLNLHWQTYTPADSTSTWIEGAWFTNDNAIKVVKGSSKPSGTYFTNYMIKSAGDPNSPFIVNVKSGDPLISLKNSTQVPVAIDTSVLRIAIYSDKYDADVAYLRSALLAIGSFMQRKIVIKQFNDAGKLPMGNEWLFWLSEKAIDNNSLKKTARILSYEPGKVSNTTSWIKTNDPTALAGQNGKPALYKLIKNDALNRQPIWVDGYGSPVLSMNRNGSVVAYHFYSRFNPAWNDMVWDNEFAKLLMRLIVYNSDYKIVNLNDRRVLDRRQLLPNIIWSAKSSSLEKKNIQTDLSHYFWLTLILLFLIERWMAHKNKLLPVNG